MQEPDVHPLLLHQLLEPVDLEGPFLEKGERHALIVLATVLVKSLVKSKKFNKSFGMFDSNDGTLRHATAAIASPYTACFLPNLQVISKTKKYRLSPEISTDPHSSNAELHMTTAVPYLWVLASWTGFMTEVFKKRKHQNIP